MTSETKEQVRPQKPEMVEAEDNSQIAKSFREGKKIKNLSIKSVDYFNIGVSRMISSSMPHFCVLICGLENITALS